MKTRLSIPVFGLAILLILLVLPGAVLAQPVLTNFSFTPTSINTSSVAKDVTVSFTANDAVPLSYFEMIFVDPTGVVLQRGFKSLTPATNVTDSVIVTFPAFSNAGTWKVAAVFLADQAGKTLYLDTAAIASAFGPTATDLSVSSATDTTLPDITTFTFGPASINTTSAAQEVTVNFAVTDNLSGVASVYAGFVSPSGQITRGTRVNSGETDFTNNLLKISFPKYSETGTWKVSFINVVDAAGNSLLLDTAAATARGFETSLAVTSTPDTTLPTISSFSFAPASINTTSAAQDVTVTFAVADDVSGVASVYAGFVSPSGQITRGTRVNAGDTDFTNNLLKINFPKLSDGGTWKVSFINVVDAAGNSLFLDTAAVAARSFPTDLTVTTTPDTQAPSLTAFSFAPSTIGVNGGNVMVNFTATDDASGANSFEVVFRSPSGNATLSGAISFPPAPSVSSAAVVTIPGSSEPGTWRVISVFLADLAGNTRICTSNGTGCAAFPTGTAAELTVSTAPADPTPPVILLSLNPLPNAAGWNNTSVDVVWTVSDPESQISSSTGCGPATLTNETAGTTLTCSATSAGGTSSSSVTIRIDKTGPVTSSVVATPSPKPATTQKTITGAANNGSGLIRITATAHGFATGNYVTISGVNGTTEANGLFPITVITADTFDLVGSAFVNAYVSGGVASVPLVISATVTDGLSGVASAEYNIDGGVFDDLVATDGSFGGNTENVLVALPITHPVLVAGGVHTFCVRGIDAADIVGAAQCVTVTIAAHAPPPVEQFGFFVGLRNTDDLGTNFDLQVEVLKNSVVVATGLTRCVEDVVRNANQAKEVSVVLPALTGVNTGEVLSFRISTRIGTNPDDTKCGGHNNATGLRLYYDSTTQPSLVQAEVNGAPVTNFFLHTTGASDFFDTTTPAGTTAKTKDSASVNFAGGNPFKVIGTWSRTQP